MFKVRPVTKFLTSPNVNTMSSEIVQLVRSSVVVHRLFGGSCSPYESFANNRYNGILRNVVNHRQSTRRLVMEHLVLKGSQIFLTTHRVRAP
jgi:hypothetical protein